MSWTIATLLAALVSAVVNFAATRQEVDIRRRVLHAVTGVWSLVYVYFFGELIFAELTPAERGEWSRSLTPLSFGVFIVVWSGHALLTLVRSAADRKEA